jgi:predicted sugar kinase
MDILAAGGGVGIGQSSWGPTGFCLVDSPDKAESLRAELTESLDIHSPLQCLIATPRSRGAEIQEIATGFA